MAEFFPMPPNTVNPRDPVAVRALVHRVASTKLSKGPAMTDDLRQAAERIVSSGEPENRSGYCLDAISLARAYLAEHAADDDEPVTEGWLIGLGCTLYVSSHADREFRFPDWEFLFWYTAVCGEPDSHITIDGQRVDTITTRGQVRRLIQALNGE